MIKARRSRPFLSPVHDNLLRTRDRRVRQEGLDRITHAGHLNSRRLAASLALSYRIDRSLEDPAFDAGRAAARQGQDCPCRNCTGSAP